MWTRRPAWSEYLAIGGPAADKLLRALAAEVGVDIDRVFGVNADGSPKRSSTPLQDVWNAMRAQGHPYTKRPIVQAVA